MSWFQSLRDELSLKPPFDTEHSRSDRAAMASGPPDVMTSQEPAEVQEECPGKKKSKFQTFKKFFARKKRKEPSAAGADDGLKASQSSDNVSKTSENDTLTRSEKENGSGSKISLGSKALSHDSVFVSDSSEATEALGASQDSIHGKVKSLQLQLKQAIKLGSPPSLICVKGREDAGAMSEDDGLPCSPPEFTTLHTDMNQTQRNSSISLERGDRDDDQLSCAASSRAVSPLVVPGDFSQPASPYGCLDNSAAKHKMGLRHKACNKRKPVCRLEVKSEGDVDVDEVVNESITEAVVEQEERHEVVMFDDLRTKVKMEEEEVEEEEEVKQQPQHSTQSLLIDTEEGAEEEEELEAEHDVSYSPDASPPLMEQTEEDCSDAQPLPSTQHSSTVSSLDSVRVSPEPPAGVEENLLDPSGIGEAEENRTESEFALNEELSRVQESREEESSFLQEVLSSLKTPLAPCSLGTEAQGVRLMQEEVKDEEREDGDIEEGQEMREDETELEEAVGDQAALTGSMLLGQTTEEEEQVASSSSQEEVVVSENEVEEEDEEREKEGEVVERFALHHQEEEEKKEEAEEIKPEEENHLLRVQEEEEFEEEYQSEGEEEAIELEKEPGVEEEGQEKTEEGDPELEVKEEKERVEEAEEAIEEERDDAEEMTERFHEAAGVKGQISVTLQEADEGVDVVVESDTLCTTDLVVHGEIPAEPGDEEFTTVHECQERHELNSGDERDDGGETDEEAVEAERSEQHNDDVEATQRPADHTERDLEQEAVEMSLLDLKQVEDDQSEEAEQATVASKPASLSFPEPHCETQSQESGAITPSKTSTTTLHINLVSPSSEKVPQFFQTSPTAALPQDTETPSHAEEAEQTPELTEKEATGSDEEEEEKKEQETPLPDSVEETVKPAATSSDQSKVRFTIHSAWQRSQSLTPPSSPPACVSSSPSTATGPQGEEAEAAGTEDPAVKTEPASSTKVELVLSPGRARNAGSIAAKPQGDAATSPSCAQLQTSEGERTQQSAQENAAVAEGNANNPFGVRLRKTPALHRFSSEEENTESPVEPPVQPLYCKGEPAQPVSVKPFVTQPFSNKPALPKKPDGLGDSGGRSQRISEPTAGRGVLTGSNPPSWISVAQKKHKIYKENSLDDITAKKEEPERKSSLPTYISSAASREQSNKTSESVGKVNVSEIGKHSASIEKETRGSLSPPTPVPPQHSKSGSLPCSVPPKPQVLPTAAKPPPQPNLARGSLSPPTPVPVSPKSPSCTSPPPLSKPLPKSAPSQSTAAAPSPFSLRTPLESTSSRAPSSQRALPPPALPQDEPPWMALAKKKAKAWSEMPQIVQ